MRAARAEVDLDAVRHNVSVLARHVDPADLCAVVKADGYGHGSIAVSHAALEGGARWLAVALVEEGAVLRKAGIDAPILLLSQPRGADVGAALRWGLSVGVYTRQGIEELAAAAAESRTVARVHLKVNTGMNRVGASRQDAVELAGAIEAADGLELEGVWTHCAVADEPGNEFTDLQLERFEKVIEELDERGMRPAIAHAANSAGGIDHPRSRYQLVRAGIAIYGIPPSPALAGRLELQPAMRLVAEVSHVSRVAAGEGVSYGHRYVTEAETVIATLPIGYADGVPRRLPLLGGTVLIGGRRRPMVGVVTMDQLMVDCGPESDVGPGDEAVLLGRQGHHVISPDEWAAPLETISYEIVCGIGPRVPRHYRPAPPPAPLTDDPHM